MKKPILISVVLAIGLASVGCHDSEREMLKRTSDGTDTFHYKPDPRLLPKKTNPSASSESASAKLQTK